MLTNNYLRTHEAGMLAAFAIGNNHQASTALGNITAPTAMVRNVIGNNVSDYIYGLTDPLSHSMPSLAISKPTSASSLPTTRTPASGRTWSYFYMAIGNGRTPATPDDYTVENIITTLTYASATGYITTVDGVNKYHRAFVLQNTASEAISVSEICFFARMDAISTAPYLMCREVLAEPITVAPSEFFTVTLSTDGQVDVS